MKQLILLFLLLITGCTSTSKIYTPQVNKAPHGWSVYQWQNVIDCSFKEGKGSDWDCDSCYITYAKKYHITVDTTILNYY